MRGLARAHRIHVHGGSIIEAGGDKLFNTTLVFDPDGREIARYRKIHLFDITGPDGTGYRESALYGAGDELVVFEAGGTTFGCTVCYDMRFAEQYIGARRMGAEAIFVPSNFTLQTGKDHWEALLRARAIESQCWIIAAASWGRYEERGARALRLRPLAGRRPLGPCGGEVQRRRRLGHRAPRPGSDGAGAAGHAGAGASRRPAGPALSGQAPGVTDSSPAAACRPRPGAARGLLRAHRLPRRDDRGRGRGARPPRRALRRRAARARPPSIIALGGDGMHAGDAAPAARPQPAGLRHELRQRRLPDERLPGGRPAPSAWRRRRRPCCTPCACAPPAPTASGSEALAINEVSLLRETRQAAKIRILVDGKMRLAELICDGILVCDPGGQHRLQPLGAWADRAARRRSCCR